MSPSIFHFKLHCRGTLVDTVVTDCRDDFEEIAAYASTVRERGIQERKPMMMDMLPDLKAALIATVRASLLGLRVREGELKMECIPQAFVCIERCVMALLL